MSKVLILVVLILFAMSLFITTKESYVPDKRVEVRSLKYFYGPNEWNYVPTLEVTIDIKEFENLPSDRIPHLYDDLVRILPSLESHRCSPGYRGGFLERVKKGTYFGHILEHITLELQLFTGFRDGMGRTRSVEPGVYKIAITAGHHSRESIIECFQCALDLLLRLIDRRSIDLVDYQRRIVAATRVESFGSNMLEIIYELKNRNIPYFKLADTGSFIQIGYGNQQKRLWITTTGACSGISENIVANKTLTKQLLAQQGISTPVGELATSVEDAVAIAEKIGYPVVVKPCNGNHANGVGLNLTTREDIEKAFPIAVRYNRDGRTDSIVERYVEGDTHRVTVVDYHVVAACRHVFHSIPVRLKGDGLATIERLVERIQASFLLQGSHSLYGEILVNYDDLFFRHNLFTESLEKRGYKKTDVLEYGVVIDLDLVYDGYQDTTLSEALQKKCELAARVLGVDIVGIDMIINDSTYSILEANAGPDIRVHRNSRNSVGEAIVNSLFPVHPVFPIIGITGDGDRAAVNRMITTLFRERGVNVGSVGEVAIGNNHSVVQNMLSRVDLEMAVIDNSSRVIDQEGLSYCYSTCAIILGKVCRQEERNVREPDNSFRLLRSQIDVVGEGGKVVLNGDDPYVSDLIAVVDPNVSIILYATSPITSPHRVIYYDAMQSVIWFTDRSSVSIPFRFDQPVEVVLPALAALW